MPGVTLQSIQDALLDGELDAAAAARMLGPTAYTTNRGRTVHCDVTGRPFVRALIELEADGAVSGVHLQLREPVTMPWLELLDIMGRNPEEQLLLLDHPGGPLSFTLTPLRGRYPGIVIVEIDSALSTLTSRTFGERTPTVAVVLGSTIRRSDSW